MGLGQNQNVNKTVELANVLIRSTVVVFGVFIVGILLGVLFYYTRKCIKNLRSLWKNPMDCELESNTNCDIFPASQSTDPFLRSPSASSSFKPTFPPSESPPPSYASLFLISESPIKD